MLGGGVACQLGSRNSVRTEVCNLKATARWMGDLDDAEATLRAQSPQSLGWSPEDCGQEEPSSQPLPGGRKNNLAQTESAQGPEHTETFSCRQSWAQPLKTCFMADKSNFTHCRRLTCIPTNSYAETLTLVISKSDCIRDRIF